MDGNSIIPTAQEHDDHYGNRCAVCDCRLVKPAGKTETGDWLCFECDLHYEEPAPELEGEQDDE